MNKSHAAINGMQSRYYTPNHKIFINLSELISVRNAFKFNAEPRNPNMRPIFDCNEFSMGNNTVPNLQYLIPNFVECIGMSGAPRPGVLFAYRWTSARFFECVTIASVPNIFQHKADVRSPLSLTLCACKPCVLRSIRIICFDVYKPVV